MNGCMLCCKSALRHFVVVISMCVFVIKLQGCW